MSWVELFLEYYWIFTFFVGVGGGLVGGWMLWGHA